ncbi:hypothetical protein GJ496_000415 [Pomphorhynchus laevis]|nr:hypothetical protein GJ496_000415 [Pomphorhynchus laevis]
MPSFRFSKKLLLCAYRQIGQFLLYCIFVHALVATTTTVDVAVIAAATDDDLGLCLNDCDVVDGTAGCDIVVDMWWC